MANIYFVKDGKKANGDRITHRIDVPLETILSRLGGYKTKYTASPPTVNPSLMASEFSGYKHVVLEVLQGETSLIYPQVGYYLFEGLDVPGFKKITGIDGPSV